MAIRDIKNNVADWLPKEYEETQDLGEFRKYFVGDQFLIVSGPWCKPDNNIFINFTRKLREESLEYEKVLKETGRGEELEAHQKGDELGLMFTGDYHETWGEEREKWLLGREGQWYWINRKGELFRWDVQNNIVNGFKLWAERTVNGRNKAVGTFVAQFGEEPDGELGTENEFYQDPLKLCARPFKSISTGTDVLEKMAGENGTRRIGLFDEQDKTSFETRIKSHQLLTGTLFGQVPDPSFRWTFESLLQQVDEQTRFNLKAGEGEEFRQIFKQFVEFEMKERFDGSFDKLRNSNADTQLELWYRMWEALEMDAPARQTCIIVTLNEPVLSELDRVVGRPLLGKPRGRVLELATGRCGIKPENLHIGGPPVDNVAIDEEGTTTLLRLVNLSALIGIILAYLSFRSIRITFMLFFVGGVAAISSMAFVWFGGSTPDAILLSMPSLVYVLGLSGAVHVVNYYRDACHESGPETAAEVAVKNGWFPCTLAAFTTAIGLISLYTSQLVPIQKFGLFAAIGTLATVVLLFTYLPSALTIWPPGYLRRKGDAPEEASKLTKMVTATWMQIGEWVIQHNRAVVFTTLILMGVFAYGVSKVKTSVHLLKLFDSQAKILQDYRWLEDELGKLVPMELVVCVDAGSQKEPYLEKQAAITAENQPIDDSATIKQDVDGEENDELKIEYDKLAYDLKYSMLERMELSYRVRTNLEFFFGPNGLDVVGPGMSTDVFAPIELIGTQVDPGNSVTSAFHPRRLVEIQLPEMRDEIVEEDYLAVVAESNKNPIEALVDSSDPKKAGREMWRISLRLAALNDVDYGDFVNSLKVVVEPIMKAYEYRTEILKKVQDQLGEQSLTEGRILVLGRNPDRLKQQRDQGVMSNANVMELVDQTCIFSSTLRDLLENRGFTNRNLKEQAPYANKRYHWVDPTVINTRKITQESFAELIKGLDGKPNHCVVLIEDHLLFDEELIRQHANVFVDCRQHQFEICLLYTSPSPRDRQKSRMPSSA